MNTSNHSLLTGTGLESTIQDEGYLGKSTKVSMQFPFLSITIDTYMKFQHCSCSSPSIEQPHRVSSVPTYCLRHIASTRLPSAPRHLQNASETVPIHIHFRRRAQRLRPIPHGPSVQPVRSQSALPSPPLPYQSIHPPNPLRLSPNNRATTPPSAPT